MEKLKQSIQPIPESYSYSLPGIRQTFAYILLLNCGGTILAFIVDRAKKVDWGCVI
jgi:hypothetical protein